MSNRASCQRRRGFTLVDLVALVVIGAATTIAIRLYSASINLNKENRRATIAASIAEGQMALLLAQPGAYDWGKVSTDAPTPVTPKGEDGAGAALLKPFVEPTATAEKAAQRERNFYELEEDSGVVPVFEASCYARLPEQDSDYVEVTVVVRWQQKLRERMISLTSVAPRTVLVEETS